MGNSHCVPQAPRRLRASFSRKPSLKGNREDGARMPAGLLGPQAARSGDAAANKLFHYIPGADILDLENQRENLEQPFLSVFKKARRRVPVRNLGKVVHYAKVQLIPTSPGLPRPCEAVGSGASACWRGPESTPFRSQDLERGLPCGLRGMCVYVCVPSLPRPQARCPHPSWCSAPAGPSWTAVPGTPRPSPPRSSQPGSCGDELPWTLQRRLTRLRTASGHEPGGSAVCASRVKLQHLPAQEQWDRLLVLYPTSLAIFSEELDGLCFKGELPLRAVHINLEEKEKQIHSFLIEGPLINTIRVVCASYEDYSHWLLCLRAITHREGAPPLPGTESFPGLQVTGSSRGSLSSGGRTSWDSGCLAPPSTRTSHSLPESSVPSTMGCSSQHTPDQANSDCTSVGRRRTELRRSSSRSPRSKARAGGRGPATPLHLDLTQLNRLSLENSPDAPDHASETSHSPLYADPYTPPATSHRRVTDVRGLEEFLSAMPSPPGPVPLSPLPLVPVSVPASDPGSSSSGPTGPHWLSKKGVLQSRASQRQRGSAKDGGPQPPDSPQLVSSAREGLPEPRLPLTDGWSSRRSQGPACDHLWDETLSSSHRKCPQLGGPEASAGLVQWI
uniref:PH domain-containing protein n=1 Tax=Colobus angolensis palliatus TaxID=336983 RepID=A0A2K5HKD6_COLAP